MDRAPDSCCGRSLEVIRLAASDDGAVELLRCRTCGRSSWRRGDRPIARGEALGALSRAAARPARPQPPAVPAPRRHAPPARTPARTAAVELADLLPGWRVLGG